MPRASRSRIDRREAIKYDQENQDYGGDRPTYVISDSGLEKLKIGAYYAMAGDKGAIKDHYLHILPPHPKDGLPISLKLFVHYSIGPEDGAYLCPAMMKKTFTDYEIEVPDKIASGICPVCAKRRELLRELKTEKNENPNQEFKALENEIKGCNFSIKHLMWVVDATSDKTEDEGIKCFFAPKTVYDGVLDVCKDRRTVEIIDITDPDEGEVFIFSRIGGGQFDTKYKAFTTEDRKAIPDEWLDGIPRYTDVLVFVTPEELQEIFEGVPLDKPNKKRDVTESEEPRRSRRDRSNEESKGRRSEQSRDEETEKTRERGRRGREIEPSSEPEPVADSSVDEIRQRLRDRRNKQEENNKDDDSPF